MGTVAQSERPLRVLAWPGIEIDALNPYTTILYRAMGVDADVTSLTFSADIFLKRFDIVHLHWPELARSGGKGKAMLRVVLLATALWLQRIRGARVIRTVHNLKAHDRLGDKLADFQNAYLEWLTDGYIHLQAATLDNSAQATHQTVIPHPYYDGGDSSVPGPETGKRNVLWFGRIRKYKGVEDLARIWDNTCSWGLKIVGNGDDPSVCTEVRRLSPEIDMHLGHATEDELDRHLEDASLVCLPYRAFTNSGSAFRALTRSRPVLLPESPGSEELREQVGKDWVHLYSHPLDLQDIELALASPPKGRPDLTSYNPARVAQLTLDFYRTTLAR